MKNYKRISLIIVPMICICMIVMGMTQHALAATPILENQEAIKTAALTRLTHRKNIRQRNDAVIKKEHTPAGEVHTQSTSGTTLQNIFPSLKQRALARKSRRTTTIMQPESMHSAGTLENDLHNETIDDEKVAQRIFDLANEVRAAAGLAPFTYDVILERSAEEYADHMRATTCFSHSECGSTLKERMHASGYYKKNGRSYSYGENIARGQDSAEEAMEDWMNSPPHRVAILSETFTQIGIGKSGSYWVQHFGAIR